MVALPHLVGLAGGPRGRAVVRVMASSCEPIFKVTIGIFGGKEALEGGKGLPEFGAIEIFEFGGSREEGSWRHRIASRRPQVMPPRGRGRGGNFISASSSSGLRHL